MLLSVQPSEMMGILLGFVAQLQIKNTITEPLPPPKFREQERLNYSMIVSLFAVGF
jgi:hypothetical protein